uniref:Uncharacterized protein n=1 Tax=Arundo donax TaxID=35708 RepID=A0A0A9HBR2_ARUDO
MLILSLWKKRVKDQAPHAVMHKHVNKGADFHFVIFVYGLRNDVYVVNSSNIRVGSC